MNTKEAETTTANWLLLGSFAAIIAVLAYLIAGTKLVRFIQFFITRKHYKRLNFSIEQSASSTPEMEDGTPPVIYQTPRASMKKPNLTVA